MPTLCGGGAADPSVAADGGCGVGFWNACRRENSANHSNTTNSNSTKSTENNNGGNYKGIRIRNEWAVRLPGSKKKKKKATTSVRSSHRRRRLLICPELPLLPDCSEGRSEGLIGHNEEEDGHFCYHYYCSPRRIPHLLCSHQEVFPSIVMSSAFEEASTPVEGKDHELLLEENDSEEEVESISAMLEEATLRKIKGGEKSSVGEMKDAPPDTEPENAATATTRQPEGATTREPLQEGAIVVAEEEEEIEEPSFHGLFPQRQLFQPSQPYPLWDEDWDGRRDATCTHNVTRHIILVRHGQYDETYMRVSRSDCLLSSSSLYATPIVCHAWPQEDERRCLTDLGRRQATLTGLRIAEMIHGLKQTSDNNCCTRTTIRSSDMMRAKETADIICKQLPTTIEIHRAEPDELLNEGVPAQVIPVRHDLDIKNDMDQHGERIETAFQTYFYRWTPPFKEKDESKTEVSEANAEDQDGEAGETAKEGPQQNQPDNVPQQQHEFEIIVCHGNVVRYFFCRALQLPPEAWLRMSVFNCSLTYLMIRPTGHVTCRMLGDIGHLPYNHASFSMNHGFAWS